MSSLVRINLTGFSGVARMTNHPNRSRRTGSLASNPSPQEIREAREQLGLDYADAGLIVHSSARAWQSWELGARRMHPAIWELFRIKTEYEPLPVREKS